MERWDDHSPLSPQPAVDRSRMADPSAAFKEALAFVQQGPPMDVDNEQKLQLYALFKQATVGPNTTKQPSRFDMVNRFKWNAWTKLGSMSQADAQRKYVALIKELAPSWSPKSTTAQTTPKPTPAPPATPTKPMMPAARVPASRAGPSSLVTPDTMRTFQAELYKGKVVFVTGGGTGINRAVTEAFMKHGADACIMSRKRDRLEQAATEMSQAYGTKCLAVQGDVRTYEDVERAMDRCIQQLGRIDVLVNGAAGNFLCSANRLTPNGFRTVMEIDTLGTFHASKAVYARWFKQHGGSIINMSMTLHWMGTPLQVHAGAAKAGIDAMTRHLAVEWGPNKVRVNSIAIGPIAGTEGFARLLPASVVEQMRTKIPVQRFGSGEDIASTALFLASPAADYVTGSVVTCDGGHWMTSGAPQYPEVLSKL